MLTLTSPIETWLHRVPTGPKFALLCLATIVLFRIDQLTILTGVLVFVALFYIGFGRLFFAHGARMLIPLLPFGVVITVWHWWIGDLHSGIMIMLRLVCAVAVANLVTMTTRLSDMVVLIERMTPSIAWLGLKPKAVALSIALAIRFIPVLGLKVEQINLAWKARSARRSNWRILIPILLAVLDDAEHVAEALRARGGIE